MILFEHHLNYPIVEQFEDLNQQYKQLQGIAQRKVDII